MEGPTCDTCGEPISEGQSFWAASFIRPGGIGEPSATWHSYCERPRLATFQLRRNHDLD